MPDGNGGLAHTALLTNLWLYAAGDVMMHDTARYGLLRNAPGDGGANPGRATLGPRGCGCGDPGAGHPRAALLGLRVHRRRCMSN